MLIGENILLALSGLLANKMRALLTMLGIIIGIASVIAIMSVGNSISTSVTSSMEDMGVNNITLGVSQKSTEDTVTSDGRVFAGVSRGSEMSDEDYITDEMLDAMKEEFSDSTASILLSESAGSGTAEDGDLTANVSITGVNSDYLEYEELTLLAGRTLTDRDQENAKKVVLVSDRVRIICLAVIITRRLAVKSISMSATAIIPMRSSAFMNMTIPVFPQNRKKM